MASAIPHQRRSIANTQPRMAQTPMPRPPERIGLQRAMRALLPMLGALIAACGVTGHQPGTGEPQLNCAKIAARLTPADRLEAMITIHAYAFGAEHERVLKLTQAATILECDFRAGSALARSRKRRAVAELAAYGRLERFEPTIDLFGTDLKTIRLAVAEAYPGTFWYLLAEPAALEMAVSNLIATNPSLGGLSNIPAANTCGSTWQQETPFSVWPNGGAITVDGKVSVVNPVKAVESNMDGQRWDECSPLWDPPPTATELVDKQMGGGFVAMSPTPAPGSDYGPNTLFEHFECGVSGCLAWFENLLQVKNYHTSSLPSDSLASGYVVSYDLPEGDSLGGCVGGPYPGCGGGTAVSVLTDHGWLEISSAKMRTMVYTHKEVTVDNTVVNGISQALLAYAELDRELAEQACCLKAAP
jgi:hypothetical protein